MIAQIFLPAFYYIIWEGNKAGSAVIGEENEHFVLLCAKVII